MEKSLSAVHHQHRSDEYGADSRRGGAGGKTCDQRQRAQRFGEDRRESLIEAWIERDY